MSRLIILLSIALAVSSCGTYQPPGENLWLTVR